MNPWQHALVAAVMCLPAMPLKADESEAVTLRSRSQQRTQWMAEQLMGGVLDFQLRQLKENELQHLPIYADILAMRGNLSQLAEEQMQTVADSLAEAQRAAEPRRSELLRVARYQARDVVVVLLAERERLRRRMKIARLSAELEQLIDRQGKTLSRTAELREKSRAQQDLGLLRVIEDQRDIHVVFAQLLSSLDSVSQWGGRTGASAASCLQLLTEREVELQFAETEQHLASAQLASGADAQRSVIRDLQAALQRLRDSLVVQERDKAAAASQVREILQEQTQLRDETRKADLDRAEVAEGLSQRQRRIHEQVNALNDALADSPQDQQLAESAEEAAYKAEGNLFQSEREAAMENQQQAMAILEELAESLERVEQQPGPDPAAAQRAAELEQLRQLDQELRALDEQQSQIMEQAGSRPAEAARGEQQVTTRLQNESQRQPLSETVRRGVNDAAQAARQATEVMQDSDMSTEAGSESLQAARDVKQALQQVMAKTEARMDEISPPSESDASDLFAAAEDLERAARVEQELAEVAAGVQLDSPELTRQIESQSQATESVRGVAKQVQQSSPAVSQQLDQIGEAMRQIGRKLEAISADRSPAAPAVASTAGEVARDAEQSAAGLRQMASRLRQQMGDASSLQDEAMAGATGDPSQDARNGDSQQSLADGQSQSQSDNAPAETSNVSPSESGNRLASDPGRVERGTSPGDPRALKDSPWFARLPPAVRESIRARTRRQPPRGYEERLRRYFESDD